MEIDSMDRELQRVRLSMLLKDYREDRSYRDTARDFLCSASTYRAWEKNEVEPKLEQLEHIAKVLGVSFPKLYYYLKGLQPTKSDILDLIEMLTFDADKEELKESLLLAHVI